MGKKESECKVQALCRGDRMGSLWDGVMEEVLEGGGEVRSASSAPSLHLWLFLFL
jgi:hypothetical protein